MASKINSPATVDQISMSTKPEEPSALSTEASGLRLEMDLAEDDHELTDDEVPLGRTMSRDEVESVVGVSIGIGQVHYKSSQTPASEKSKVLEDSWSADVHHLVTESPEETQEAIGHTHEQTTRLDETRGADPLRGSATRSILANAAAPGRQRSPSGPAAVTDSLRKLFHEMPSLSLPRSPTFSPLPFVQRARRATTMLSREYASRLSTTPLQTSVQLAPSRPRVLGSVNLPARQSSSTLVKGKSPERSPLGSPASRDIGASRVGHPHGLRRTNSDDSLYLQRTLSRTSTLGDIARWEHVQDQVNSRFKAITDSLQDSKIRMPKMPSVDVSSFVTSFMNRPDLRDTGRKPQIDDEVDYRVPDPDTLTKRLTSQVQASSTTLPVENRFPSLSAALAQLTGDVVILGGYRGSILRSAKPPHQQLWIPLKVGLNLRKVDLEVGLSREDEERMVETIVPSGILSHVGPIDICRRLLRKLQKCPNAQKGLLRVHDYGYDWRLSPDLLVDQLIHFLESLKCNEASTPKIQRGTTVVAHSLGGLLVRSAVNLRPDLFAGVVYAGVPQHCVNILGPLRNGDDVLFSSRVLTAQVNFTIRTSFALMPESGICFFNRKTKERYDLDFFDPRTWEEYRLTPCLRAPLPPYEQRKSLMDTVSESIIGLPRRATAVVSDTSQKKSADSRTKDLIEEPVKQMQNATIQPSLSPPSMQSHELHHSVATRVTISRHEAYNYLTRTLASVLAFKRTLVFNPEHQSSNSYPPAAALYGKSVPTVYGARVASKEAIKHADAYDDLAFAAGDGVVLAKAAMLPEGYRVVKDGLVRSERGHVGLLGDLEGVGRCLLAVIEGRKKGIGLGMTETVQ